MKIFLLLAGLFLASGTAQAAPLDLSGITTSVDFSKFENDTVIISPSERRLFYKTREGAVVGYSVGVAKEGMSWSGAVTIQKIKKRPDWNPPAEMLKRQPWLPKRMAGGWGNPLGAYALYLYKDGKDTEYRIHGTNSPDSIGYPVTSGCIRMFNAEVTELAGVVRVGTKVVMLP